VIGNAHTRKRFKSEGKTVIRKCKAVGHVKQASAPAKGESESSLALFRQTILKNARRFLERQESGDCFSTERRLGCRSEMDTIGGLALSGGFRRAGSRGALGA